MYSCRLYRAVRCCVPSTIFICGVKDTYICEKLLQMDADTTLTQTLDATAALEAARKENTDEEFSFKNKEDSVSGSINQVSRSNQRSKQHKKYKNSHSYPRNWNKLHYQDKRAPRRKIFYYF